LVWAFVYDLARPNNNKFHVPFVLQFRLRPG
jgi:hypothetical protein